MRRVYHPYQSWEDFQAGMFHPSSQPDQHRELARALLSAPDVLLPAMRVVVTAWPVAAEHNLTALDTNRRAWLGAAVCCHRHGAPENATREAWWSLSLGQQGEANAVAEVVIAEWERNYSGTDALFPWPPPTEVRTDA